MSNTPRLTEGAIKSILDGKHPDKPVLQILAQKNVSADNALRYRLLLSDGKHSYQCCIMMSEQAGRVENGEFERFTVIRLNKYILNSAGAAANKKVLILLEPEVVIPGSVIGRKIGAPMPYEQSGPGVQARGSGDVSSTTPSRQTTPRRNTNAMMDTSIREEQICPISAITPYQNKWAIKGRVTNKSGIKTWNNAKGEGQLFSFTLQDDTGEIRATAFKAECDRFYDVIELGKVYKLSRAIIKQANKKFSDVNHDYELTLHGDTIIEPADENDTSCPQIAFNFIKIGQIDAVPPNTVVDVVGVCRDPGEVSTIMSKNLGKELKKRDISLVDDSEVEIRLTLWNTDAENFHADQGSVVVAKKARVSDFNGKSLSTVGSTLIQVDPDLPEAQELKGWYQLRGHNIEPTVLTSKPGGGDVNDAHYLNAITKEAILSAPSATLIVSAKAAVTQTGKAQIYMACPDGCKKKLIEMNNGFYKCDKCNKDVHKPDCRIILNLCISDFTGSTWITAFHDESEKLLGRPAQDLAEIKEHNEEDYDDTIGSLNFKTFNFRFRAKMDHFKEEARVRCTLLSVSPINTLEYGRKILKEIQEMIA